MKTTVDKKAKQMRNRQDQRGVAAVITAICLVMLLGFAALAIDVGHLYATRNELQNTADAAALAGAGELGRQYSSMDYVERENYTYDRAGVLSAINNVAVKNRAAGVSIAIAQSDVIIGCQRYDATTGDLILTAQGRPEVRIENCLNTNLPIAVQLTARRDGTANTPVATFFARVLSANPVNVSAFATAALTCDRIVNDLETPFALSENVFPNDCVDPIEFSPTPSSCAGWHNFFDLANASSMEDKMLGLVAGDTECDVEPCGQDWLDAHFTMNQDPDPETTPATGIGDSYEFIGGSVASLFNGGVLDATYDGAYAGAVIDDPKHPAPFPALFDYFRFRDGDGNDTFWTTTVPVYSDGDGDPCTNPSGTTPLVGFADIVVRMPNPPPATNVSVTVYCNLTVKDGRGSGFGGQCTYGDIPNLIE